jgi:hypothetical protein
VFAKLPQHVLRRYAEAFGIDAERLTRVPT